MKNKKYLKLIFSFCSFFSILFLFSISVMAAVDPYASFRDVPEIVNQQQEEIQEAQRQNATTTNGIASSTGLSKGSYGNNPVLAVLKKVTEFVTGLIAVISILMIVISGIMYITSAGDDKRVETAKNMLTYSITGLIISLLAYVIVVSIGKMLGI